MNTAEITVVYLSDFGFFARAKSCWGHVHKTHVFDTAQEAYNAAAQWCIEHGYEVVELA